MTDKRVQGRTVPQPHQRSLVNRIGSKCLRKCTIKKQMWIFLMQQYLLLWVFVNSRCAITVIQCPTGLNCKSGCTKKKKLNRFLVLPACGATVPTVFLRVAEVPRGVILFNHSFSWCMLLIFWLIALATQSSWTASLPCSCSAFTLGAALWWNPEEGKE